MTPDPKSVVRRYVEECVNGRNLDLIEELFAPDFVDHTAPAGSPPGQQGRRTWLSAVFEAFPDMESKVEEMIGEGDIVATRVFVCGTHTGPLMNLPPTGKTIESRAASFDRVVDGRIVEKWELRDPGLMKQLRG